MVDKISYMNAHAETPAEQQLRFMMETKTGALQKKIDSLDANMSKDLRDSSEKFKKDLKDSHKKFENDLKDGPESVSKQMNKKMDDCFDDIRRDLRGLVGTFEQLFQHSEETLSEIQRIKSDFSAHLTGVNEKCLEIKAELNSEPLKADKKAEVTKLKEQVSALQKNNIELKKENTDLKSKLTTLLEYIRSFFSSPRNKNVSINDSRDAFFSGSKNTLADSPAESAPSLQATI